MVLNFTEKDLAEAVTKNIITQEQYKSLSEFKSGQKSIGNTINLLYYGGALLIISSLTWLITSSWEKLDGLGIFGITLAYLILFLSAGILLYPKKQYYTPSGLMFSIVVCLVPLLLYGLLKHYGYWDTLTYNDFYVWVRGKWVVLELGGIIVALIILYFVRFPFLLAPISFGLWFLSMDIVPIIFRMKDFSWTDRKYVSLVIGTLMLIAAYLVHKKTNRKYAFWMYLFSVLMLSSATSVYHNDDVWGFVILFIANLFFIILWLVLDQKVFLVFGIIGLSEFLGRLAFNIFKDTIYFQFVITAIGILIIIMGLLYQKNKNRIESKLSALMPKFILKLKPEN